MVATEYIRGPPDPKFMFLEACMSKVNERDQLLERLGLREASIVHYDIRRANSRARTVLNRFLFGRTEVRSSRTYRYPGMIAEGAEWVGQSVFLLNPDLADRLTAKLQELHVRYRVRTIFIET